MMRAGVGYDSHRVAAGGRMLLGGIEVARHVHLEGHSDGDAVAHAVTDAVLGAAGSGDIGSMFPDTDPANAGRDSMEMLRSAVDTIAERGFTVVNIDVTVIAESPKIAPFRDAICESLAASLRTSPTAVSVKGKTNEGMGWIGRGEGLACIAVAMIRTGTDSGAE